MQPTLLEILGGHWQQVVIREVDAHPRGRPKRREATQSRGPEPIGMSVLGSFGVVPHAPGSGDNFLDLMEVAKNGVVVGDFD
jgi:hypothetical protein